MKKFLSLVLALVMTMSLVTVSAGAKDYADADKITYVEAVDVLSTLGVLEGDANGFRPNDTLKRSEAAKIICALNLSPKTAASLSADTAPFADVPVSHWAAGYIAEGVDAGILAGVGGGKFAPDAELTGYAYLKMLLVCLGYDAAIEEMTGANWSVNVAKLAKKVGLTDGNDDFVGSAAVTREEAALYALNALQAETVEYDDKGTNITINGMTIATGASKAKGTGEDYKAENYKSLKPTSTEDAYGRPSTKWTYKGDSIGTYAETPVLTITEATKKADVIDALEELGYDEDDFKVAVAATKNGVVTEFFGEEKTDEKTDAEYNALTAVVSIDSYVAKVTTITKDKKSTDDDDRAITFGDFGKVVADKDAEAWEDVDVVEVSNFEALFENLEKGDKVIVTLDTDKKIETVAAPEVVEGDIDRIAKDKKSITVDGTVYKMHGDEKIDSAVTTKDSIEMILDAYGYVLAYTTDTTSELSDVVMLVDLFDESNKYGDKTYYAQVVTIAGETEEWVIEAKQDLDEGKLYTYDTNDDDEYVLTVATEDVVELTVDEIKVASYINIAGKKYRYADDVTMIYVDGKGAKLEVEVADELKKVAEVAEGSYAVLDDDGDICVYFIADEASAAVDSDELIYIAADACDGDHDDGKVYEAYINGEAEEIIVDTTKENLEGFFKYSVDEDEVYTLKAADVKVAKVVDTWKDTLTLEGQTDIDFELDDECIVLDLSENGIEDVETLADYMEENAVTAIAVYDADDEVVTYVVISEVE